MKTETMSEPTTNKKYTPQDPGLNVDQVAAELGCDRSSARRLIVAGALPHYIVAAGRRKKSFRVRRSVLKRWIESQERQSVNRK